MHKKYELYVSRIFKVIYLIPFTLFQKEEHTQNHLGIWHEGRCSRFWCNGNESNHNRIQTKNKDMASLEEEIASLEQKIAEYESDLRNATTPAEKSEIRGLITARSENLTELLKEKKNVQMKQVSSTIKFALYSLWNNFFFLIVVNIPTYGSILCHALDFLF